MQEERRCCVDCSADIATEHLLTIVGRGSAVLGNCGYTVEYDERSKQAFLAFVLSIMNQLPHVCLQL